MINSNTANELQQPFLSQSRLSLSLSLYHKDEVLQVSLKPVTVIKSNL